MREISSVLFVTSNHTRQNALEFVTGIEIFHISGLPEAVKAQEYIRPDLIVIDGALLTGNSLTAINEFKQCNPIVPIVVMVDGNDGNLELRLIEAGVDYFLPKDQTDATAQLTILRALRHSEQLLSLSMLNHHLHAMLSLSRLLYEANDTRTLMGRAAHLLRSTSRLYGVYIVLKQDDIYHAVVSSEDFPGINKLYETILRPSKGDPFVWSIENKTIQLYDDIQQCEHFEAIPVLKNASVAAITPLVNEGQAIGALGIFRRHGETISYTDCFLYEEFANHVASALIHVGQTVTRSVQLDSRQLLLRAWQSFSEHSTTQNILTNLCQLIKSLPEVASAVVRLPGASPNDVMEAWIDAKYPSDELAFDHIMQVDEVRQRIEVLAISPEPVVLDLVTIQELQLGLLLQLLGGHKLLVLPLKRSSQSYGVVFVAIKASHDITDERLSLLRTLCLIADQMIERLTLSSEIYNTNQRLEAILNGISEGIFFVDHNSNVVYVTPQFTELTSINLSGVLGEAVQAFLQRIVDASTNPPKTAEQLESALAELIGLDGTSDAYPIVQFQLAHNERTFTLELVRIIEKQAELPGWCGIIRSVMPSMHSPADANRLVEIAGANFDIPYARVRGILDVLNERRRPTSTALPEAVISELLSNVQTLGNLWSDFTSAWWLHTGNLNLSKTMISATDLLDHVLKTLMADSSGVTYQLKVADGLPQIMADGYWMKRVLRTIVGRAVAVSPRRSTLGIEVKASSSMVSIIIEDRGDILDSLQLSSMFSMSSTVVESGSDLALFLAREIVVRHGGDVWAQRGQDFGTAVMIKLPALVTSITNQGQSEPETLTFVGPSLDEQLRLRGAPARHARTAMVLTGQSHLMSDVLGVLQDFGYEVFEFDELESALENLNAVRIGLIILDVTADGRSGLKACERIRKRSTVPILLVSDAASDSEKVAGLKAGADDLMTMPISPAELAARIEVIVKRQDITDRSQEPIVVGELQVDVARRQVFMNGQHLDLTRIEYDLLHALLTNSGRVLMHRELLEIVWGPEYADDTQYLWVNISRLRKKVERDATAPRYIHTQPGVGYYFDDHGAAILTTNTQAS